MATQKQKCEKCHKVGYFHILHNGDSSCCHCGKISKDHDDIVELPSNDNSSSV